MSDRPGIPWGCYGLRKHGQRLREKMLWQHVDQQVRLKLAVDYALEQKKELEEKLELQVN